MRTSVILLAAATIAAAVPPAPAGPTDNFLAAVQGSFAHWDANHDGILSVEEIDAAVADASVTGTNAAALAALKRASRLATPPLPPLTLEYIAALAGQPKPDFAKMYRAGCKHINGAADRSLFANDPPRLDTIHQGELGNCFCLAPLGAMLYRNPADVAAMFAAETNGEFSVHIGKKTVAVPPPTEAEIAMTSSNDHAGIWLNLYEKAVGTARNEDRPENTRYDSPLDALARGGSAGTMLAYITGHDIERFSFKFAKLPESDTNHIQDRLAALRVKLSAAARENRLMTAGTLRPTTPDLNPNHAYAVLGYDAGSDLVRLWNPHGENFTPKGPAGPAYGYATAKGVFQIPVADFVRQFAGMAFEVTSAKVPPSVME